MLLASSALCWLGLASGRAMAGDAPSAWSNLWRTPDQQGQALLDAGNPAEAAGRFDDPRLRAYADLQAARNQEAAKLLQPFTDAESEYNRGNALAKAGQLQDALAAYNAALKQAPADKDIRHNRDLLERALRQQQKSQSSRSGGQKSGQSGRKSGSSGQQQHSGAGQGSGSQQSSAGGQRSSGGSQGSSNVAQGGGASPGSSGQQQAGAGSSGTSKEAPGQAQRDAAEAAALAHQQPQQGKQQTGNDGEATASTRPGALRPGSRNGDQGQAPGMQSPRQQPETEKQLALDQWLRQIPDSPAGLLQRKFLIEHMMKQQGGDEPPDSGP